MEKSYQSLTINLEDVIREDIFFSIPIYQRPYVWAGEQIKTLLSDIVTAYLQDKKSIFYLGNVIVKKSYKNKQTTYELIDGQQRFTTLWLLSIYLRRELKSYAFPSLNKNGNETKPALRVKFDIRDKVTEYMNHIVDKYGMEGKLYNGEIHTDEFLKDKDAGSIRPLYNAFNEIDSFFKNRTDLDEQNLEELSAFIKENVKLVKTVVPPNVDLNKLFEVLNNRGIQLEHHQILKARMLDLLQKSGKYSRDQLEYYAILWDSCSEMNEYIEMNFYATTGKRLTELSSYKHNSPGKELFNFKSSSHLLENLAKDLKTENESKDEVTKVGKSIAEALQADLDQINDKNNNKDPIDDRSQEVKSIINFPMLLEHTLRIYNLKENREDIDRILDKDLIRIFERSFFEFIEPDGTEDYSKAGDAVADFIELLWEIRFVFDKYVVKWSKVDQTDILKISPIDEKKEQTDKKVTVYLRRRTDGHKHDLAQLQRMLYHSQEMRTFYWLTPYLLFLNEYYLKLHDDSSSNLELSNLQYLDHHLLNLSLPYKSNDEFEAKSLSERTWIFMEELIDGKGIGSQKEFSPDFKLLDGSLGLRFPHYWFYKLEYLLWRKYISDESAYTGEDIGKKEIESFKITAKNSVEHIAPQHPIDGQSNKEVSENEELLDSFGNLALVSRSINSSWSNSTYRFKREKFYESNIKNRRIEALKLLSVYRRDKNDWTKADVVKHHKNMKTYFEEYDIHVEECKKRLFHLD
ncbi:MAG: DUF262 domain-containing protein [Bacteroidetes bacterium]|jgi:uncharacterized protein with ParB-like and HNH nuclease domain|nr:DUF262 domain-containing protein [Bacteroidota bacterium]